MITAWPTSTRIEALRAGAAMLRDRHPTLKCHVVVVPDSGCGELYAQFNWPGIVRVTARFSGKFIAQSLPGRPFDIDMSVLE